MSTESDKELEHCLISDHDTIRHVWRQHAKYAAVIDWIEAHKPALEELMFHITDVHAQRRPSKESVSGIDEVVADMLDDVFEPFEDTHKHGEDCDNPYFIDEEEK